MQKEFIRTSKSPSAASVNSNEDGVIEEASRMLCNGAPCGRKIDEAVEEIKNTPLFVATALSNLRDALEMIPLDKKKDYVEAARLLPNLIKTDSDPVKFLRSESYNPWAAARSLVLYWEYRRRLFGDRWLLHMNDTGAGALDANDIDLLRSGWLAFATPKDTSKGRFLLIDHGKFRGHQPETQCRVLFYLCSAASDEVAQTVGVTGIRLITTKTPFGEPAPTRKQFELARLGWKMLQGALPVRLNHVILLKIGSRDKGNMINFFINRVGKSLFEILDTIAPLVVSIANASEAAEKLKEYGVSPVGLPRSHGGTWTYDRLFEWKSATSPEDDIARLAGVPRISQTEQTGDTSISVGALYAKRAYRKRKQKLRDLEDDVHELKIRKARLQMENDRLEALYQQASDIFAVQEVTCPELPNIPVGDMEGWR